MKLQELHPDNNRPNQLKHYCRPSENNSFLAVSQKHLQIKFAEAQKRYKNMIFLLMTTSDKRLTPKASIQFSMTTFEPVLNSFIKHLVKTKSNECLSVALTNTKAHLLQRHSCHRC